MDIRRYDRITFWIVLVLGVLFALNGENYASAVTPCIDTPLQDCPPVGPTEPGVVANDPPGRVIYVATPDSISILNPERGFYRHQAECNDPNFGPNLLGAYRDEDNPGESYSLVMCIYYLPKEPSNSEAFQNALVDLQAKAEAVKAAGLKMILRFAYTVDEIGDDMPLATVEEHLDALASTLQEHSDVIAIVQSGFVGAWGEGSDSQNCGNVNAENWECRWGVVKKLLEVMPSSRTVQVRRPWWKNEFAEFENYDETADARIGHHNDCFLRNELDADTYDDPSVDKPYLEGDTRSVAMGGETCPPPNPRSECGDGSLDVYRDPAKGDLNGVGQFENPDLAVQGAGDALEELKRFHYSYLNLDWSPAVLSTWGECMETVKNRLGYRLSLVWSQISVSYIDVGFIRPIARVTARISIRNAGWAAPFNPRPVYLVLQDEETDAELKLRFDDDPRQWVPGMGEGRGSNDFTLSKTFLIRNPSDETTYNLFLSLPDPLLEDVPEHYSIRLANVNGDGESLWNKETGYNDLLRSITTKP